MKLFLLAVTLAVASAAPAQLEERDILGAISGLLGSGGSGGGLGNLLNAAGSLLGKSGTGAAAGGAAAGGAAAGGAAAGGAATGAAGAATGGAAGAIGGLDKATLGAIGGVVNGLFNIGKVIAAHGSADPHNGADIHHHGAEAGAQNAILKALANGDFGY